MMFSDTTRRRLEQLLPRLASDKDAEVVGAARALQRILSSEGRDFHDLAKAAASEPSVVYKTVYREQPKPQPQPRPEPSEWLRKALYCESLADRLSDRESEFVSDMAVRLRHRPTPTEKQAAWLDAIYHRLLRQRNHAAS